MYIFSMVQEGEGAEAMGRVLLARGQRRISYLCLRVTHKSGDGSACLGGGGKVLQGEVVENFNNLCLLDGSDWRPRYDINNGV